MERIGWFKVLSFLRLRSRRPPSYARLQAERLRLRTLIVLGGLAVGTAYLGRTLGLRDPIYLTSEVTLLLAILIVTHSVLPYLHRHEQGAAGEERVAEILGGLRSEGYVALHNVDLGWGNIDHVLIGPGGVFTVETKSRIEPIAVRKIHGATLEQARTQQRLLERVLDRPVQPLLVYSHAWVDRPFARRRGVIVLPARLLPKLIASREPILDRLAVRAAHQRLLGARRRRRRRSLRLRELSLFFPPGVNPRSR